MWVWGFASVVLHIKRSFNHNHQPISHLMHHVAGILPPSRPMRSISGVLESSRLGVQSASLICFWESSRSKRGSLSASSAKSTAAAVLCNRGQNLTKIQHDPLESSLQALSFFNIIFTTIIGASISLPLELAKIDHLKQARTLVVDCSKVHQDTSTKCGGIHDGWHERSCPPPDLLLVASFSLRLNSLNWPRAALGK